MDECLGMRLRDDVITGNGLVLIPAGTILAETHLRLLLHHRIPFDELRFGSIETEHDTAFELVREATQYAKDLFHRIRINRKIPLLEIKHELIPMVREAAEIPNLFKLVEAVKAKDEYTHRHTIGVSVLAAMLGHWLGLEESEITLLTMGATLHDVGKIRISDEILLKPGKLTDEEFTEMRRHTVYGYELLKEAAGLNPRVAFVALQHHERGDGTGYPLRLRTSQIDPLSRIVAVVDIFHAMSSKRPYHEALPFYEVVNRMRQGYFGEMDPYAVSVFLKNMVHSMLGKQVILTDGRFAEVIYINPHDDTNPLVKVQNEFIDLSREREIRIREVIA
ncbi:HD-GYP domain-containing protein [Gorillibacterium sp. sgz5001074]|uniref:HD-GYP domain-containing protein n=1 Tax=Gorillibacterium sp. sgz5001074 TaxID=3446695 RepID=UPI003F67993D